MSNVLKKITKKYKWLRFLNYKTTKLAVLSAVLFGLCLSSGASFAKYRDENYGNGNAGIATMGGIVVTYTDGTIITTNQLPSTGTASETGWHAFIATIKVQFFNVELKQKFKMTFKLGNNENTSYADNAVPSSTSFALPNNVDNNVVSSISTYAKKSTDSKVERLSVAEAKGISFTTWDKFNVDNIVKNKGYYGVDSSTNASIKSTELSFDTWYDVSYPEDNSNKTSFTTIYHEVSPNYETTIYFYKILYFVNFGLNNTTKEFIAEESKIFYQIEGEQVN